MPGKHRKHTPLTSERQMKAMGMAYSAKKGEIPISKLRSSSRNMAEGMSTKDLKMHLEEWGRKHKRKK